MQKNPVMTSDTKIVLTKNYRATYRILQGDLQASSNYLTKLLQKNPAK